MAQKAPMPLLAFYGASVLAFLALLAIMVGVVYELVRLISSSGVSFAGLSSPWVKVVVSAAILLGAVGLYALKESRYQPVLGLAEIAVGLVANWRSLSGLTHQANLDITNALIARVAVLGGGMYLIGRGINNVLDGVKKIVNLSWLQIGSVIKNSWREGYDAPTGIPIPKRQLNRQISSPPTAAQASDEKDKHELPTQE